MRKVNLALRAPHFGEGLHVCAVLVAILLLCSAPTVWAASLAETMEAGAIGAEVGASSASSGVGARERALAILGVAPPAPEPSKTVSEAVIDRAIMNDHPTSFPPPVPDYKPDMGDAENLLLTTNIFANKDLILQWLGDRPKFVYDTGNKSDPMLIPWLAEEYKATLLQAQAVELWETGGEQNWAIALHLYEKIIRDFSKTTVADKVLPNLERFKQQYSKEFEKSRLNPDADGVPVIQKLPFPQEVKEQFTAICTSRSRGSSVIIKGKIYRVGAEVSGNSGHPVTLVAIERVPDSRERYGVFLFEGEQYFYKPFMPDSDPSESRVPGKTNPDEIK